MAIKTKKALRDRYVGLHFQNVAELQELMRKEDRTFDYVDIGGILYTMEEYDISGKEISYMNKRTGLGFTVTTKNRYECGFGDAEICEPYVVGYYRNDIVHAE